ncbi:MAG: 5-keto-L-gluconate epimerase [bacterium]
MKLSIVLSTQPAAFSALAYQGELEANIAKIAALGYDGVELAVRNPELLTVKHIKKSLKEMNLSAPAIGTGQAYGEDGLCFTHPNEKIRETAVQRIKAHIGFAANFQAQVIIGLIRGRVTENLEHKQASNWLVEALKECSDAASRLGIKLALEPINRYETNLVNTVADGLDLIEKVASENLGLLLDTFHMNIEEPSIEDSIQQAGNRIFHFHVADSNRWYPGAGHIDFKRIVEVLNEVGYKGFLSAEILPLPDSDTCAEKTVEFLRPILSKVVW